MTRGEVQNRIRQYHHKTPHHFVRRFLILCGFMLVAGALGGLGLFSYYASSAPTLTRPMMASDSSAKIYDSQNHLITKLNPENREYITYNHVPKELINGVTSIENQHFFTDHGVDPVRIIEAEATNLYGDSGLQGGSTITQQLVKLSAFSTSAKDRTMKRKAQEAWLAMKLTHDYPKRKILEYYLNKVYMGHNTYGMETASKYYYGKPLNKLSLAQTAMLSGMPQSPVDYDPYSNKGGFATKRRNQVLTAMAKDHKITAEQADNAKAGSVKDGLIRSHKDNSKDAKIQKIDADYIKQVSYELKAKGYNIHSGLKIYTDLNQKDQNRMYDMANGDKMNWPNHKIQVGSALVNVHNGDLEAIIGGRHQSNPWSLNRADQTSHSNGSTNKPLMDYAPALQDLGYKPGSTVHDTPFYYPGTSIKLWDFDHKYKGAMSLRDALVQSRNVPAIKLLQQVGVQRARRFLKGLGLYTNPKDTSLQNGIGGYTSPVREAEAYSAFANGGVYHQPSAVRKVVENGNQVHRFHSRAHQAMSMETAQQISEILRGVPKSQDAKDAKVPGLHEAGKTGTTQYPDSYKYHLPSYAAMDSWYAGFTPNLSMTVWTGYDSPMEEGHYLDANEINLALQYYKNVMETARKQFPNDDW